MSEGDSPEHIEEWGLTMRGTIVYYDGRAKDYFIYNKDQKRMEVTCVGGSLTTWFYAGTEGVVP
tara:strand:+ start:4197 stop:4388 length:192 start_codon:yes stop_codon:yes gene_type:complete